MTASHGARVPARGLGPATTRGPAAKPASGFRARLAVVALLAGAVAGCATDQHPVIMIDNQLAIPVTVVFVSEAGAESSVAREVPARSQYPVSIFPTDRCTPGVLVARDPTTGAEVARSTSPVCRPSRWVIPAAPSST